MVAKTLDGNGLSCPVGSQEIIDPETVKRFGIIIIGITRLLSRCANSFSSLYLILLRNCPYAFRSDGIVQTVGILLESGIATVAAHEHVGVHEYVVGIEWACLACHYSEYKVWELFLLFFGQRVRPTGGPKTYEFFNELSACQSVFLQKQFYHTLALLLNLFVSFAHFAVVLMNTAAKIIIFFAERITLPLPFYTLLGENAKIVILGFHQGAVIR